MTVTPSVITVTFNKPIQFSTVTSSDLQFTSTPPGVSVVVGTPQAVDNATDPTIVAFPYTLIDKNPPPSTANGTYTFVVTGSIHLGRRENPVSFGPDQFHPQRHDRPQGRQHLSVLSDRHHPVQQGDEPEHDYAGQCYGPEAGRHGELAEPD